MGTTLAALKNTITTELGAGGRRVELGDSDLVRAIQSALRTLARYLPEKGFTTTPINTAVQKYVIDRPNIVGISDVVFFNNGGRLVLYPYPDSPLDHSLVLGQMREQQLAWEDLPTWEWLFDTDPNDGDKEKCYLLVSFDIDSFIDRFGRIPTHAAVEYLWYIEASDDKKVGLPRLKSDLLEWVEKYAAAKARLILGDIRNKFGGIPGPAAGMTLPIDGSALIDRAQAQIEKLEAEMKARRRQLPPRWE